MICFFLAISVPLLDMALKLNSLNGLSENRERSKQPPFPLTLKSLQKFPQEYSKYFNDNFGFRNALVRVNFFIKYKLLGASTSREVIVGKDGWLFYAGDGEMEDFRGITNYDKATIVRMAATFEIKQKWLASKGIRYLFVIAPNKSTIYGEWLPDSYNRVRTKTGSDELVEYLRQHTQVEVVDLGPSLITAKSKERIYHKTDTHWNGYGAFIAYQSIMKPIVKWFPELNAKSFDNFSIVKKAANGGDLASMIGGKEFIEEEYLNLKQLNDKKINLKGVNDIKASPLVINLNNPKLIRAIVFRDSFLSSVIPLLTDHFDYAKYYWKSWDTDMPIIEMVDSVKPDIVIEEIVERFIKHNKSDYYKQPPDFVTNELFRRGHKIFTLDMLKHESDIERNADVIIALKQGKLNINATGNDSQVILPLIKHDKMQKHESCIMKLTYTSYIDTTLQLFYKIAENEGYSEEKSVKKQLPKGSYTAYITIPYKALTSKIRIDPSTIKGHMVIDKFEIRAVSMSKL